MLSTRPDKYVGDPRSGTSRRPRRSKRALEEAPELPYIRSTKAVARSTGPKIDVKIKDSLGRYWQCSTVQARLHPARALRHDLHRQDGGRTRPVMIHRALLGSLERFFGILVEHYGGAFPVWLAPVQARDPRPSASGMKRRVERASPNR